ncbi:hypothetical protein SLEP1_g49973 [Rubroshorea leprosula]|uniref:Receptor-like serine/threonine-protein kinase n=1 Tax=Rubroshorea leprosula TaxID=152421 RepID=A0AAV5LYI0_9ROSI|nr:hypothetical protein SLEP1_g49973 [Rubroshorea leprosula]
MDVFTLIAFVSTCFLIFLKTSTAIDSISPSEPLPDGKTLISNNGSFELGFFHPGSSGNRYLGIWYKNIPVCTVVWVANRVNPINDSSGMLMVTTTGDVQLLSQNITVVWSANSTKPAQNPKLRLLDSGNLVLIDGSDDSEVYLWQSFDYPSDTLLPEMKLGWDLRIGLNRRLSAWKNSDDPSPGDFTLEIERQGNPEAVLLKGSEIQFRFGPWNGIRFSGAPSLGPENQVFGDEFVSNEEEVYYMFFLKNKSLLSRVVLNQTDNTRRRYTWDEETRTWKLFTLLPNDYCDQYGLCGAYGNCDSTQSPACQCFPGFKPKSPDGWSSGDWSQGCVRNKPLNCQAVDMRQFQSDEQDLFIRMSASESGSKRNKTKLKIALLTATPLAALLAILILCYYFCKNRGSSEERIKEKKENDIKNEGQDEDMELPVFQLATISHATNNFSLSNKLGQGGFGPVYKGKLVDGQEIAVKRLSSSSRQGVNEFKNEVKLIAKLQHRNLVRLLGCCIEGEEKMLIYEYMPNRSLDSFIFDQTRGKELDWSKRFRIICGIARGLLYLHQDSRLRIIHRDLKASNVLLDEEMNPKISDFGTAKSFGGEQTEGSTSTVIGTYGYMAPEYVIGGLFSIKSDVFSFGVLLLEIISGIQNRGFFQPQHSLNLIGHAWKLWKEGNPLELAAESLGECFTLSEVIRCIHISLLCLQQDPEDRPPMSSVVMMLGSEIKLPQPKQPGFLLERTPLEMESSTSKHDSTTINEITHTYLEAR